jgi:hypothetical protein
MSMLSEISKGAKRMVGISADDPKTSSVVKKRDISEFHLAKMPPKDSPHVGKFFGGLYEKSVVERDRLGMPTRWMANYLLSRSKTMSTGKIRDMMLGGYSASLSLGLIGANIERTVANITARAPVASVQATTGDESLSAAMSAMVDHWNNSEEQEKTLGMGVKIMETYGTVVEKAVLSVITGKMAPVPLDITAFLPAPGKFHDIQKMPWCCHQYISDIDIVERDHPHAAGLLTETSGISEVLLTEREDALISDNARGGGLSTMAGSTGYSPNHYNSARNTDPGMENKVLVVEVWVRDSSTKTEQVEGGRVQTPVYPGGIRMVKLAKTSTAGPYFVLFDGPNPNVNWNLTPEQVSKTFLVNRYPFYESRSYTDTEGFWGYSQAETTGDIAQAIDELWRMVVKYLKLSLLPPVILPKDTGIDKSKFAYIERLVLQPNSYQTSLGIRFLEMPVPPSWLFQAIDILVRFFDRTSQIEDVDRGSAPEGIVAASAIQMLQERAAVLMRAKIRAVDGIVRNRGRCFISFLQNFHSEPEVVNVSGTGMPVRGLDFLEAEFAYIVESGSTVIKTEAEERQQAADLFQMGAIDQVALLEAVKFRGWRQVVERMAEAGPLEQAMQILIQAGLPEELVQNLYEFAKESQGGPGNDPVTRAASAMKSGGTSMADNTQPMAQGKGGGGANMRGKAPQRENGGAPAKPGVPMAQQNG